MKQYDIDVEATEEYRRMGINLRVIVPRKRAKQASHLKGFTA